MERRIKLTMAAVALGLLVAGAVRRWAKEEGFTLFHEEETAVTHDDAFGPVAFDARQTAWTAEEQGSVAHAAAQFPLAPAVRSFEPAEIAEGSSLPQPHGARATSEGAEMDLPAVPPSYQTAPQQVHAPAAPARSGVYVTQPNDSFWTISQRVYGTGRYFQALYEHNRRSCPQPDRLPPGMTIETPEPYLLERAYPDLFR